MVLALVGRPTVILRERSDRRTWRGGSLPTRFFALLRRAQNDKGLLASRRGGPQPRGIPPPQAYVIGAGDSVPRRGPRGNSPRTPRGRVGGSNTSHPGHPKRRVQGILPCRGFGGVPRRRIEGGWVGQTRPIFGTRRGGSRVHPGAGRALPGVQGAEARKTPSSSHHSSPRGAGDRVPCRGPGGVPQPSNPPSPAGGRRGT